MYYATDLETGFTKVFATIEAQDLFLDNHPTWIGVC